MSTTITRCGLLTAMLLNISALGGAFTAENSFSVQLGPPASPDALLPGSPFGVNTAFGPDMCFNTHIHPCGVSELRSADLLVRFHLLALVSGKVEKVFWWTFKDLGPQQFDAAEMVGFVRTGHLPVPLGESPIYAVGPAGLKASVRKDPGW